MASAQPEHRRGPPSAESLRQIRGSFRPRAGNVWRRAVGDGGPVPCADPSRRLAAPFTLGALALQRRAAGTAVKGFPSDGPPRLFSLGTAAGRARGVSAHAGAV